MGKMNSETSGFYNAPLRMTRVDAFEINPWAVNNLQFNGFIDAFKGVPEPQKALLDLADGFAEKAKWPSLKEEYLFDVLVQTVKKTNLVIPNRKRYQWAYDLERMYHSGKARSMEFANDSKPAVLVSFEQAAAFALWVSSDTNDFHRLPTEAEREYAAKGLAVNIREALFQEDVSFKDFSDWRKGRFENFAQGQHDRYVLGNAILDPNDPQLQELLQKGLLIGSAVYSTPNCMLKNKEGKTQLRLNLNDRNQEDYGPEVDWKLFANSLGLVGMGGNVQEWVMDYYASAYDLRDINNPIGPLEGQHRVVRGGNWFAQSEYLAQTATRTGWYMPQHSSDYVGLRLVKPRAV